MRHEFLPVGQSHEDSHVAIQNAAAKHSADGAKWMRVTRVNAAHEPSSEHVIGFWLESMTERPRDEPPFLPPLTLG